MSESASILAFSEPNTLCFGSICISAERQMSPGMKQDRVEKVLLAATVEHLENPVIEGELRLWQD